jgi:hypothetical protein
MIYKKKSFIISFWLILSMFVLFSCNKYKEMQINEDFAQTTPTNTVRSILDIATNTQSLTKTPIYTATPLPTLNSQDSEDFLSNLLKNNGSCSFPCLWGNEPGITNSDEAKNFFELLQTFQIDNVDIYALNSTEADTLFIDLIEDHIIASNFSINHSNPVTESLLITSTTPNPPTPAYMVNEFSYYSISNILLTYGSPQKILVGPFPFDPDRPGDRIYFNVVLFYSNQNFFIEYLSIRKTEGDFFIGCPSNPVEISILTWEKSKNMSIEELLNLDLDLAFWGINKYNYDEYYRNLEDVLISKDDFYDIFVQPEAKNCLKIEKRFWNYD